MTEEAGVNQPELFPSPGNDTAVADPEPQETPHEETVPYQRFNEVNERMKEAEQRAQRAEDAARRATEVAQQIASRYPQQPHQAQPQDDPSRPWTENVDDPEAGRRAYEAVNGVAMRRANETAEQLEKRLRDEFNQTLNSRLQGFQTTMAVDQKFSQLKEAGLINDEAERSIRQTMGQYIQQHKGWGEGQNQMLLLNNLYADGVMNGTIKPGSYKPARQPGSNPLQPGGTGRRNTEAEIQRERASERDDMRKAFPRKFGHLSDAELDSLMGHTTASDREVDTRRGPAPESVVQASYVHVRPTPGGRR